MVRALVHAATTVILAVLCVFAFGLMSYQDLPRESAPDVEIPVVIVSTPYIGVSPEDIEGLVTIPIENELASLTDVKVMRSSSAEGISIISIEFEPEVDIDDALQKVRDRVSRAKSDLPEDAEEPSVNEVSFSDIPILLVTLAGGVDEQELKKLAESLQDEVTRIPGVLEADVSGGREREIRVEVDPRRLSHYGLKLDDVVGAIQGENVNIPGGDLTAGKASFLLRTPGEFTDPLQLEEVAIKRVGDRPVFLTDVARVVDGFEDRATYSRMNGRPCVTLSVKKRTGANMLAMADEVKALVATTSASWPDGVDYSITGDQSEDIELMVSDLQNNIATALILVVAVLLAFMGARNSLFVAVAIPLSMLMSFGILAFLDFTLNMVVLFALILALGMLVDNGIVVVENVYRHQEMGKSRFDAAIDGTNEVAIAVAASTATTVAAFFPLIFWTGIMGQFMGYLPKTVIIVLVSSLVVAVVVLPVLTSRLMSVPADAGERDFEAEESRPIEEGGLGNVMGAYFRFLRTSIRWRYLSVALGIAVLVGSFGAYGVLNHGMEFFPATAPDRATIAVRLPEGADLEATDKAVRAVETVLSQVENVETYVAEVGVSGGSNPMAGASNASNQARVTLDFLPAPDKADPGDVVRVENTFLTMVKLRRALAGIPGAEIKIDAAEMGPPVGAPIGVEVTGEDYHQVGAAAAQLMRELARIEGVTDLESDYRVGRPELRLRVDRGAANRVGVSTRSVGSAVRTAIAGTKASALRDGEDEYDIVVTLAPETRDDLQEVLALRVPGREDTSPNTFPVPLSAVATYELAGGSGTIHHVDQDLVVTIEGDVDNPELEAMKRDEVAAFLATWDAPAGITATMGGASDEQAAAEAFLGWAFMVAVALILLVLVTQFDSLAIPGIILFTVLLSLVGVLWGLIVTGTAFGLIMTGIGVISLAGVVVNNAIVLLDYVGQLRKRGLGVEDALLRAGVTRFRPVMLTAVTTTLGLIPMAIGASVDFSSFYDVWNWSIITGSSSAQFWGPMAIAVIFGLVFATLLTLVMVPTLYAIYEDALAFFSRLGSGGRPAAAAAKVLGAFVLGGALLAAPRAHAVSLDEAFAAAEANNLDLKIVREQVAQASTYRWQALSALMPRVSANANFNVNQTEVELDFGSEIGGFFEDALSGFEGLIDLPPPPESDPIVVQPKTVWQATATIYQPLLSGQALPAYQGARLTYAAAQAEEQRARQQVRAGVAQAYYGLATARQARDLSEAAIATAQHQLELAQRQVDAGLTDRRALLQAELGLARAERDLLQSDEQVVSAEESFWRVTGLPRSSEVAMPDAVEVPKSVEVAVQTAIERRPDLDANRIRVDVAKRERLVNDLEWVPTVDFTFTEIYNQVPGFVPENFQWQIGLNFKWTLWDGGMRIAKSRELASRTRQARLVVEQNAQQAEQEVRVAWERLRRAERALSSVAAEIALAEESLELAERGFSAGSVTWLDVEQARLSLESSRLSEATERMNRDLAAVDLLLAAGVY